MPTLTTFVGIFLETKKSSENYLNSPKTNNFSESFIFKEEITLFKSGIVLSGANNFNKDNKLVGMITSDDVLTVLKEEAEEDALRLAGVGDEEITDLSLIHI